MPHEHKEPKAGPRVSGVFEYRVKERKGNRVKTRWHTMVSPDPSIEEAERELRMRFGDDFIGVRRMIA